MLENVLTHEGKERVPLITQRFVKVISCQVEFKPSIALYYVVLFILQKIGKPFLHWGIHACE